MMYTTIDDIVKDKDTTAYKLYNFYKIVIWLTIDYYINQ